MVLADLVSAAHAEPSVVDGVTQLGDLTCQARTVGQLSSSAICLKPATAVPKAIRAAAILQQLCVIPKVEGSESQPPSTQLAAPITQAALSPQQLKMTLKWASCQRNVRHTVVWDFNPTLAVRTPLSFDDAGSLPSAACRWARPWLSRSLPR